MNQYSKLNNQKPPQSSLPPWLRDDNLEDVQPLNTNSQPNPSTDSIPFSDNEGQMKLVHWVIKIVIMFLCILMAATAIVGVEYVDGVDDSGKIFVAIYMLFFSTLLFIFETIEIRSIVWIEHLYRRNFGFLFGPFGKSLFLIFIAFLCFGLDEPVSLTYSTGSLVALMGFLLLGLYLKYPEVFEKNPHHPLG